MITIAGSINLDLVARVDRRDERIDHPLRGVANYQNVYKLTYVRGPSDILVMFAQRLSPG